MTKAFIKFPTKPVNYAPKIQSRRLGHRAFQNIAYKSDGDGETEEEKAAKAAFLQKVKDETSAFLQERGIKGGDELQNFIKDQFQNLSTEQRNAYNDDMVRLNGTIRAIAGEVEKINQRANVIADQKTNLIVAAMETKDENGVSQWDLVERAMKAKGNGYEGRNVVNLNIRAAVNMTTTNVIDEATHALPAGAIESMSMAEFVPKRRGQDFISEIADRTVVGEVDQYKVWLEEGTEEGAFAVVAEGAVKPLVSMTLVRNYSTAKKVAGKYVVTEEFAKFRKNAYNIIRRLIMDKLYRDYQALLVTDLNAQAAGYVGTTLDDTVVAPTDLEAIAAVAAQIETLDFSPDTLIIHPQDKWRLMLQKDSNGNFLFLNVATGNGETRLIGLRVVTTTKQALGYFTLGEAGTFKIEEEPITIRMGYGIDYTITAGNVTAVSSDFDTNRFRVIVETYFNDWIGTGNIGSFVRAQFSTVKAALLKP
jgi:hypothetical protein